MQQGPPGFESNADPTLLILISLGLFIVGLVVAFAGRIVWRHVMSFIGAVIGGLLGFTFGTAVGGLLVGFIAGMLGAVVGSVLFIFLMEVGLGVVAGILTFVVAEAVVGDQIVSIILAVVAFVATVVFIERAIGIVTAVVGGLLVGIALVWLDVTDMMIVLLAMLGTMVLGGAFQMVAISEQERKREAAATAGIAAVNMPAAPAAPAAAGRTCPRCNGPLTYIPEYNRFYCYKCQRYD